MTTRASPIWQPSILDRLIDNQPHCRADPPGPQLSRREVAARVERDVRWLLQTARALPDELPSSVLAVRRSIWTYGITKPQGVRTQDAQWLAREIEKALFTHEPRLLRLQVQPVPQAVPNGELLFRVTGLLRADPAPERVELQLTLQQYPQTIKVQVCEPRMSAERGGLAEERLHVPGR